MQIVGTYIQCLVYVVQCSKQYSVGRRMSKMSFGNYVHVGDPMVRSGADTAHYNICMHK